MEVIGHGSRLSGRYRLEERLLADGDHSRWRALDETLDRSVTVELLSPTLPWAAEVFTQAAACTHLDDPRLVRLLDVGRHDGSVFIVSERVPGQTLVEALSQGPLPAEAVRRLIGEAASALSQTHAQGIYHLRLTPLELSITSEGSIKLGGLGVHSAMRGIRPGNPDVAARTDALGLIALLYAGLTGRWPLSDVTGLPSAPRVGGRPVAPADLVAGVSGDLNSLCVAALVPGSPAAVSPAHLVHTLAPWARLEPLTNPHGLQLAGPSRTSNTAGVAPAGPQWSALLPEVPHLEPATPSPWVDLDPIEEMQAPMVVDLSEFDLRVGASRRADNPIQSRVGLPLVAGVRQSEGYGGAGDLFDLGRRQIEATFGATNSATLERPLGSGPRLGASGGDGQPPAPDAPSRGEPVFPAITPGGRPSRYGRARNAGRGQGTTPPRTGLRRGAWLGLAALGVTVLAITAYSLSAVSSLWGFVPDPGSQPWLSSPTPIGSTSSVTTPSGISTTTGAPRAWPRLPIAQVAAFDPQGDGHENDSSANLAADRSMSTTWRSERYQTASFSGLKQGVGLVVRLSRPSTVHRVTMAISGTGGKFEVRTTPAGGLNGSTVVGSAVAKGGKVVITLSTPVKAGDLVVWCTSLPSFNGEYRLVVSEISVQ